MGTGKSKAVFEIDALFKIRSVGNPALSPDGRYIVFEVTQIEKSENSRSSRVVLMSVKDRKSQILSDGALPAWSPDGLSIAYEAEKNGKSGIWIYSVNDKIDRLLTETHQSSYFINHLEKKNFCWSPDGDHIAFISAPIDAEAPKNDEVRVFKRMLYKSKGGRGRSFYADDLLTHIWIVPLKGGQPELLTPGDYNEHSISWSPDSQEITFVSNRTEDPDNNQRCDLWKVHIVTKKITRLTQNFGTVFQPSWSPDGRFIAFLGITNQLSTNDSMSGDTQLYIHSSEDGEAHCITKQLDRRVEYFQWHPDGNSVYFTAGDRGMIPLYKVHLGPGNIEKMLGGNFQVLEFSFNGKGDAFVFSKASPIQPPEIFLSTETNSREIVRLTNENDALIRETQLQEPEDFWVESFDGTMVQGWILHPASFEEGNKYPLILVIHGGPHNMFGYEFEERLQILAGHGYGVLYLNPRGSHGYGQDYSNGNLSDWGGRDYKDLMAGVEYTINNFNWVDKERLGVTGQSYGGYMTNWIITQTDQFKAAVVDGGISNLISFAGTSIFHSLIESEFNGSAYDHFDILWQCSPLKYVRKVNTPTMFLSGELDNEVPMSQNEEMYVALKKLGIETVFVQYVGEGHGWRPDLKPGNKQDLYNRMISWFDNYLVAKI